MSLTKKPNEVIINGDGTKTTTYYLKSTRNGLYYPLRRTANIQRKQHKKHKPHKKHNMTKTRNDKGRSRLDPKIKEMRDEKKRILKKGRGDFMLTMRELAKNDNITSEQCHEFMEYMLGFKPEGVNPLQEKIKIANALLN